MESNLKKIPLLLLFMIPTVFIATNLERTYLTELGYVFPILLYFGLAFYCRKMRAFKTWGLGNVLTVVIHMFFLLYGPSKYILHMSWIAETLTFLIFLSCWLVPQFFGWFWGRLYMQSIDFRKVFLPRHDKA